MTGDLAQAATHDGVQAVSARIWASPTRLRDPFLRRLR